MRYTVEERTRWVIWREPEDIAVAERRSFVGECDTAEDAHAEVEKLEAFGRFRDHFDGWIR